MNKADIQRLQNHTGYPRVSVLLPTHRTSPDNRRDPIVLDNLLKQAEKRLSAELSSRETAVLTNRLTDMAAQVDHRHNNLGLVLYAGEEHGEWHRLPFAVEERVIIDESYATRDLVYAFNRSPRYRVLVLSEKPTRLFEGVNDFLEELATGDFPRTYEGPGAVGPLPGGRGIEPSDVAHKKIAQFLREVDEAFARLQAIDPLPFVVTGVERYLAVFEKTTANAGLLAGTVEGSFDKTPAHELAARARPLIADWLTRQRDELMDKLESATGANQAAGGMQECWRVAGAGRVDTLLVEEDYQVAGRVNEQGTLVPVEDPNAPGVIDDAVDELIETVMARGGRVRFVKPGRLEARNRVAAILRY